jgi:hypothetical protein
MGMCGGSASHEESPYEVMLGIISKKKWQDYKARYIPFENEWIADVTQDPTARVHEVEGQVNANMAQQTANLTNPQAIDPNSGALKSGRAMSKVGEATGEAIAKGGQAARNRQVEGEEAVTALGRGTSTNAEIGYGNLAQNSSQEAINTAYNDFRSMSSLGQGIGQAAGMGYAAWNKDDEKKG